MAKAVFTNQTTPTTPTSGKTAVYTETTTKKLESVDDAGVVTKYANDADLDAHIADTANPHAVTKTQVGLSNVTNDAQLKIASNLSDVADAPTSRTNLGLGTVATLASDTDGTLAANSDLNIATQKAVKTYVDNTVAGLLDFKGSTDCSSNPNYPSALKGDAHIVSVAGKIGGASGPSVDVGDVFIASADNAGGDHATVGTSWFILEHNVSMDHGTLSGLSDDDHTQYALLSGRSGGQTINGDTDSGGSLSLKSTTHATKGKIYIGANSVYDDVQNSLGIGNTSPASGYRLHMTSTGNTGIRLERTGVTGFNINTNTSNVFNYAHDEAGGAKLFIMGASVSLGTQLALATDGNVGTGTTTPSAKFHIIKTSEQLRVGYDTSNYFSTTVNSTGGVTFNAIGTGSKFTFSDRINIPTSTPASASATGTTGDIAWDDNYIYVCTATNTWKRTAIATW